MKIITSLTNLSELEKDIFGIDGNQEPQDILEEYVEYNPVRLSIDYIDQDTIKINNKLFKGWTIRKASKRLFDLHKIYHTMDSTDIDFLTQTEVKSLLWMKQASTTKYVAFPYAVSYKANSNVSTKLDFTKKHANLREDLEGFALGMDWFVRPGLYQRVNGSSDVLKVFHAGKPSELIHSPSKSFLFASHIPNSMKDIKEPIRRAITYYFEFEYDYDRLDDSRTAKFISPKRAPYYLRKQYSSGKIDDVNIPEEYLYDILIGKSGQRLMSMINHTSVDEFKSKLFMMLNEMHIILKQMLDLIQRHYDENRSIPKDVFSLAKDLWESSNVKYLKLDVFKATLLEFYNSIERYFNNHVKIERPGKINFLLSKSLKSKLHMLVYPRSAILKNPDFSFINKKLGHYTNKLITPELRAYPFMNKTKDKLYNRVFKNSNNVSAKVWHPAYFVNVGERIALYGIRLEKDLVIPFTWKFLRAYAMRSDAGSVQLPIVDSGLHRILIFGTPEANVFKAVIEYDLLYTNPEFYRVQAFHKHAENASVSGMVSALEPLFASRVVGLYLAHPTQHGGNFLACFTNHPLVRPLIIRGDYIRRAFKEVNERKKFGLSKHKTQILKLNHYRILHRWYKRIADRVINYLLINRVGTLVIASKSDKLFGGLKVEYSYLIRQITSLAKLYHIKVIFVNQESNKKEYMYTDALFKEKISDVYYDSRKQRSWVNGNEVRFRYGSKVGLKDKSINIMVNGAMNVLRAGGFPLPFDPSIFEINMYSVKGFRKYIKHNDVVERKYGWELFHPSFVNYTMEDTLEIPLLSYNVGDKSNNSYLSNIMSVLRHDSKAPYCNVFPETKNHFLSGYAIYFGSYGSHGLICGKSEYSNYINSAVLRIHADEFVFNPNVKVIADKDNSFSFTVDPNVGPILKPLNAWNKPYILDFSLKGPNKYLNRFLKNPYLVFNSRSSLSTLKWMRIGNVIRLVAKDKMYDAFTWETRFIRTRDARGRIAYVEPRRLIFPAYIPGLEITQYVRAYPKISRNKILGFIPEIDIDREANKKIKYVYQLFHPVMFYVYKEDNRRTPVRMASYVSAKGLFGRLLGIAKNLKEDDLRFDKVNFSGTRFLNRVQQLSTFLEENPTLARSYLTSEADDKGLYLREYDTYNKSEEIDDIYPFALLYKEMKRDSNLPVVPFHKVIDELVIREEENIKLGDIKITDVIPALQHRLGFRYYKLYKWRSGEPFIMEMSKRGTGNKVNTNFQIAEMRYSTAFLSAYHTVGQKKAISYMYETESRIGYKHLRKINKEVIDKSLKCVNLLRNQYVHMYHIHEQMIPTKIISIEEWRKWIKVKERMKIYVEPYRPHSWTWNSKWLTLSPTKEMLRNSYMLEM